MMRMEEGILSIVRFIQRLGEAMKGVYQWQRVAAGFSLFNITRGLCDLVKSDNSEEARRVKNGALGFSMKWGLTNMQSRSPLLNILVARYFNELFDPLCEEFHTNTQWIVAVRRALMTQGNIALVPFIAKLN